MADQIHEAGKQAHSSTGSISDFLMTELNPMEQWRIAKEIAKDPGYLKQHPQDLLLPVTLVGLPAAHAYTTLADCGGDVVDAFNDQRAALKSFGKVIIDVADGRFGDALKDEFDVVKHNLSSVVDLAMVPIDLVKQPVEHVFEAGKDIVCIPLEQLKDGVSAVKNELHVVKDGAQLLEDVLDLNPKGVLQDGINIVKDQYHAVKDVVSVVADPIIGVGKAILDLF